MQQKIHYAASSFRDLMIADPTDRRAAQIGSNYPRSVSLRDLKRSTHAFEQRAVRLE